MQPFVFCLSHKVVYIIKHTLIILLVLFDTLCIHAENTYPANCRVTAGELNIRLFPEKSASKIGVLHKGDLVRVEYTTGQTDDLWGYISLNDKQGYVAMRYMHYEEPIVEQSVSEEPYFSSTFQEILDDIMDFLEGAWEVIKWILAIIIALLVFAYWEYALMLLIYVGIFMGIGALIFYICGWDTDTGATVGLGVAVLVGLKLLVGDLNISRYKFGDFFRGLFRVIFLGVYYIISFPFYLLNRIEHFLVEPWRFLFRSSWMPEDIKPSLRIILEILSIVMYIVTTPLRLFNAIVYNIFVHCITGIYDLLFEVLMPCDVDEGRGSFGLWILFFPWRLIKYPIFHGILTIIESVLWTVIDVFIPARTLYHGTDLDAANAITSDPNRNSHLQMMSDWSWGNFVSSSSPNCSWAGRGVYFAISRRLAIAYSHRAAGYSDPVLIVCRVSMGRVINFSLMPYFVYMQAGNGGDHDRLNKFADEHGYTTGQWYNTRGCWEYCLFDWQNGYNDLWRIRPVYILNLNTGRAQHISGGVQHWLFYRAVWKNIFSW